MRNFKTDLQKGQLYEKKFAQFLADEYNYSEFHYYDDDRFDILAIRNSPDGNRVDTFEVKTDFYEDTGNLAIELMCLSRGKLTGLYATESPNFIYIFPNRITYIFKTVDIKNYIKENQVKIVKGGDNNWAVIALVREDEVKTLAKKTITL